MVVQLLRLRAFTAIGLSSIPGQRSKIPQTVWCGQKKKKKEKPTSQCRGSQAKRVVSYSAFCSIQAFAWLYAAHLH